MSLKNLHIEFIAPNKDLLEIIPKPFPSKEKTPNWLKDMPRYLNKTEEVLSKGFIPSTIKNSIPVLDSIHAGYLIPVPCDVWMDNRGENNLTFQWANDQLAVVSQHVKETHTNLPAPYGYYSYAFKWLNPWIVKTPPGWSCYFTHPAYHSDLPFLSMTQIVDTDKYPTPVNLSFFIKKGFDGLIPMGTPMIQIIPFKRESFVASFSHDDGKYKNLWTKARSVFFNRYSRFFHSPKSYT
jgi:hypothetical protein